MLDASMRARPGAAGRRAPGARDGVGRARLRVPARPRRADRGRPVGARPARQLRSARGRGPGRGAVPVAVRRARGELEVRRPAQMRAGNLHAWARDRALPRRARARRSGARGGRRATPRPTRSRRSSTAWPPRPAAARCWAWRPREHGVIRPLLGFTREDTAAYCRQRGLAWREDESNDDARLRAGARAPRRVVPALRAVHPGAERNVLALAERLRDEGAVLDAHGGRRAGEAAMTSRWRVWPSWRPRSSALVVQRLADAAAGGPAPGVGRRTPELLALAGRGAARGGRIAGRVRAGAAALRGPRGAPGGPGLSLGRAREAAPHTLRQGARRRRDRRDPRPGAGSRAPGARARGRGLPGL